MLRSRATRLHKAALLTVMLCGAAFAAGLFMLDVMAARHDFHMVAELPPAASTDGRFAEDRRSDLVLGRTCIQNRCLAHVRLDSETRAFGPEFDQQAAIRLLRSPRKQALMLEANGSPLAIMQEAPSAWDWHAPTILDTGAWLHAYPSLVKATGLSLIVSLLLLGLRRRAGRRLASIALAREGRVDGGWLRVSDDLPPQRVHAVDDGPVLVFAPPDPTAPYRGGDRDVDFDVSDGDRSDHEQPLLRRARRLSAVTLAVAALGALPLYAALLLACIG